VWDNCFECRHYVGPGKSLICAHASDVCLYMLTPDSFIHGTLVWGAVARFWTWVTMSVLLFCNRVDIEVMYAVAQCYASGWKMTS